MPSQNTSKANSDDAVIQRLGRRLPQPQIFYDYDDGSSRIGMPPTSMSPVLPSDFKAAAYLELNSDVAEAGVDAAVHFVYEGLSEGRAYKPV